MTVRAGSIYRAPANSAGRCRYLRVLQVRGAYAIVREVNREGEPVYGRDGNGLRRAESFRAAISGGMLAGYYPMEGA